MTKEKNFESLSNEWYDEQHKKWHENRWKRRRQTSKKYMLFALKLPLIGICIWILYIPTMVLIIPEIWLIQWLYTLSSWLQIIILIVLAPVLIPVNALLLIGLPIWIGKTIQKKFPKIYAATSKFFD